MTELLSYIAHEIQEGVGVNLELARLATGQIAEVATVITTKLQRGGKLFVLGNGGSAADAQHMAAEFVGRYALKRGPLAALALTTDQCALTAIGNDFGFEQIFSRQIEALGKPEDVVLAISTSGNSPNVLRALESAKNLGLVTIGLTGKTGGKMRDLVEMCLSVPSDSTPRIQEAHTLIIHILSGIVENALLAIADSPSLANPAATQLCAD
jgi:D-sedoheptulose 7-phosphate isomerase